MTRHVLIVEDNLTKRTEIESALPKELGLKSLSTPSIAASYRALAGRPFDLIVLDMTFMVSQTGGNQHAMEALAGIELLQYIRKKSLKVPVIVATQHTTFSSPDMPGIDTIEKLDAVLLRLFPNNYRKTVRVDLSEDAWKHELQMAIYEVLDA